MAHAIHPTPTKKGLTWGQIIFMMAHQESCRAGRSGMVSVVPFKESRMKRLCCAVAVIVILAGMTMLLNPSNADDEKTPPIKEIMTKAHKGPHSLVQMVGKDLKADDPEWAEVQKMTKDWLPLATALGKNEPPQGEKESWEMLTKKYLENVKALDAAAEKKDKEKALASHKKVTGMCASCHKVHKPS